MQCVCTLSIVSQFTAEEHQKYAKRFEEGYDIPDLRYEQWMQQYHPEWEMEGSFNLTCFNGKHYQL